MDSESTIPEPAVEPGGALTLLIGFGPFAGAVAAPLSGRFKPIGLNTSGGIWNIPSIQQGELGVVSNAFLFSLYSLNSLYSLFILLILIDCLATMMATVNPLLVLRQFP